MCANSSLGSPHQMPRPLLTMPSGYEVNGHALPCLQASPTYCYRKHTREGKQDRASDRQAAITMFVCEAIEAPHGMSSSSSLAPTTPRRLPCTTPSNEDVERALRSIQAQRPTVPFYRRSHSPIPPFTTREAQEVSLRRQQRERLQALRRAAETAVRFEMEQQKRYQQRRDRFGKALAVGQPYEVEKLKHILSTRWRVAAEAQDAADHELTAACQEWSIPPQELSRLVSSARQHARSQSATPRPPARPPSSTLSGRRPTTSLSTM